LLPNWLHLVITKLQGMKATEENFFIICNMAESVDWVKKLMFIELSGRENEKYNP